MDKWKGFGQARKEFRIRSELIFFFFAWSWGRPWLNCGTGHLPFTASPFSLTCLHPGSTSPYRLPGSQAAHLSSHPSLPTCKPQTHYLSAQVSIVSAAALRKGRWLDEYIVMCKWLMILNSLKGNVYLPKRKFVFSPYQEIRRSQGVSVPGCLEIPPFSSELVSFMIVPRSGQCSWRLQQGGKEGQARAGDTEWHGESVLTQSRHAPLPPL